jgi:hypothetical protein
MKLNNLAEKSTPIGEPDLLSLQALLRRFRELIFWYLQERVQGG